MKHWIVIILIMIAVLLVAPFAGRGQDHTEEVNVEETLPTEELAAGETTEPEKTVTIYDLYSEKEIQALYGVVESEARGCSFEAKCNVCSVIFNRVESPRFKQNALMDVLMAPNQFSVVSSGAYKTVPISEDTVKACDYVIENGDTTGGALFFESMSSNIHGSYATFLFDDGKHKFFY